MEHFFIRYLVHGTKSLLERFIWQALNSFFNFGQQMHDSKTKPTRWNKRFEISIGWISFVRITGRSIFAAVKCLIDTATHIQKRLTVLGLWETVKVKRDDYLFVCVLGPISSPSPKGTYMLSRILTVTKERGKRFGRVKTFSLKKQRVKIWWLSSDV